MTNPAPIRIWRAPLTIAAITAFGLLIALVVEGAADAVGSIALAVPIVVVCWFASPRVQLRRAPLASATPSPPSTSRAA